MLKHLVVPTVDVEGVHGARPFEQMALGRIDQREDWGALRIARILREYGVTGTFFVDVYEAHLFGEWILGELCQALVDHGHDVQLHTHPSWRDDPRDNAKTRELKRAKCFWPQDKDFMYKLSLAEQKEVIDWGCDFLSRWLGQRPTAHRAGGYGANRDTLTALRSCGIYVDSSNFHGHPQSHLQLTKNAVVMDQGVLQVPITGFRKRETLRILGFKVRREFEFFRTGLDDCQKAELVSFLLHQPNPAPRILNLFMHSYSLMSFDSGFSWFAPNTAQEWKLRATLAELCDATNVAFHPLRDTKAWTAFANANYADYVPEIATDATFAAKAWNRATRKARNLIRRVTASHGVTASRNG